MARSSFIIILLFVVGCAAKEKKEAVGNVTMTKQMAVENLEDCPNGGERLEHGVDVNGNGALDADEVNHVYVLCHGRDADMTRLESLEDTVIGLKEIVEGHAVIIAGLEDSADLAEEVGANTQAIADNAANANTNQVNIASNANAIANMNSFPGFGLEAGTALEGNHISATLTAAQIAHWDESYSWGDHSTIGYLLPGDLPEFVNFACRSGYAGPACEFSDVLTCNAQGVVDDNGDCTCLSGWEGVDCSEEVPVPDGMVVVAAGNFWMGCQNEDPDEGGYDMNCDLTAGPYHQVYLDDFSIDQLEVSAGQYHQCVNAGVCVFGGSIADATRTYQNNMENHPMNHVNWFDARTYCEWQGKRLPTEAEWEKAARGTDGQLYPWGNVPEASCDVAVVLEGISGCSAGHTWEVGQKLEGESPYGAHDMIGNVWEWTNDSYQEDYYLNSPLENPAGPDTGNLKSIRGGSYDFGAPSILTAWFRNSFENGNRSQSIGFRCAQ